MYQTSSISIREVDAPVKKSVEAVVGELQAALAALITGVLGAGARAPDIERGLDVDKKRAWQLHKVVSAAIPTAEIVNIPGGLTMRRILATAAKRGVPHEIVERVEEAFRVFEELVAANGGDRAELISVASSLLPAGDPQHALKMRKAIFQGHAFVWGLMVQTTAKTGIFWPEAETRCKLNVLSEHVGVQRLRPEAPFSHRHTLVYDGTKNTQKSEVLSDEILPEFSTSPMPQLERQENTNDFAREYEVVFPPSGRAGAVTLCTNHVVSIEETQYEAARWALNALVTAPTENLVVELLVPAHHLVNSAAVYAAVYGRRMNANRAFELRQKDLLPQRETAVFMGMMEDVPALPGVPMHTQAIRHVLEQRGWLGTRFAVYRCTVQYPVLHTMLRLAVPR